MQNIIQEVQVKRLAGRATFGLALSASAMSVVPAWLLPLGGLWPSVAWAVVACVAGLWALQVMASAEQPIRDVIASVEAESPGAVLAPAPRPLRTGAD
jgi:hypothetical protein